MRAAGDKVRLRGVVLKRLVQEYPAAVTRQALADDIVPPDGRTLTGELRRLVGWGLVEHVDGNGALRASETMARAGYSLLGREVPPT